MTSRATGWLYQPFASGSRVRAPVADGAVASYLNAKDDDALVLPARSVHVPEREAEAASGPEYVTPAVQVSGPERSPAACANEIVSAWLNQPFASAGLFAEATATGGVASYLSPNTAAALLFPARSVHVPERDAEAVSGPP